MLRLHGRTFIFVGVAVGDMGEMVHLLACRGAVIPIVVYVITAGITIEEVEVCLVGICVGICVIVCLFDTCLYFIVW